MKGIIKKKVTWVETNKHCWVLNECLTHQQHLFIQLLLLLLIFKVTLQLCVFFKCDCLVLIIFLVDAVYDCCYYCFYIHLFFMELEWNWGGSIGNKKRNKKVKGEREREKLLKLEKKKEREKERGEIGDTFMYLYFFCLWLKKERWIKKINHHHHLSYLCVYIRNIVLVCNHACICVYVSREQW